MFPENAQCFQHQTLLRTQQITEYHDQNLQFLCKGIQSNLEQIKSNKKERYTKDYIYIPLELRWHSYSKKHFSEYAKSTFVFMRDFPCNTSQSLSSIAFVDCGLDLIYMTWLNILLILESTNGKALFHLFVNRETIHFFQVTFLLCSALIHVSGKT